MNEDFYEDINVKVYIHEGIVWALIKRECIVTTEISDKLISERIKMSKGVTYPTILDARKVKYWTMSSRTSGMKASAYDLLEIAWLVVAKNPFTIVLKHTLRIFPMPIRNKLFFDIASAEEWVKKQSKLLNQI